MSTTTEKMQKSADTGSDKNASHNTPKKGERFRCQQCGMELQVTADCKCNDPDHVHLQCCGQEMQKA